MIILEFVGKESRTAANRRELKRQRLRQKQANTKAAAKIQAFVRGCLCRQRVGDKVAQLIAELITTFATVKIQALIRGSLCRQNVSVTVANLIEEMQQQMAIGQGATELVSSASHQSTPESSCSVKDEEPRPSHEDEENPIDLKKKSDKDSEKGANSEISESYRAPPTSKKRKLSDCTNHIEYGLGQHLLIEKPLTAQSLHRFTTTPIPAHEVQNKTPEKTLNRAIDHENSYRGKEGYPFAGQKNMIKIFQASPLAYVDANNEPRRVPRIDIHFERETILKALKGSNVTVDFEIATDDRFGAFLAKGEGHAIHFSCHGHPKYLAFEDGWGKMLLLGASVLKKWVVCGGSRLQFVFVSACNSWSIGKAFIEAGVPHVVCCHKDTTMLDSGTAVKFTKSLYHALAWGNTLQKAFDLACQELSIYPCFEAQKFCLLPEAGDHNVHIFSREETLPDYPPPREETGSIELPSTPDFFVRDDLEMYRTIQAIKKTRIVQVTGPNGIGKSTLVKECCRYLSDRRDILNIEDIIWKAVDIQENNVCGPDRWFQEIFKRIHLSLYPPTQYYVGSIIQLYKHSRALLVMDARNLLISGMNKLYGFINQLVEATNHLKVIVIHRFSERNGLLRPPCSAVDINVNSLKIESTVKLFARYCQHVANRLCPKVGDETDLWRLLAPMGQMQGPLTKRMSAILKMIGGTNPKSICLSASEMSTFTYATLINLGYYKDLDLIECRAELLIKEFDLRKEIDLRMEVDDSEGARRLREKCDTIEYLKMEFEDEASLKQTLFQSYESVLWANNQNRGLYWAHRMGVEKVKAQICKEGDTIVDWLRQALFPHLGLLKSELTDVNQKLGLIKAVVEYTGTPNGRSSALCLRLDHKILNSKIRREEKRIDRSGVFTTRRGVESLIALLAIERGEATNDRMFERAEAIDMQIRLLKFLKCLKPCRTELEMLSTKIPSAIAHASSQSDWEFARILNAWLKEAKMQLGRERRFGRDRLVTPYCTSTPKRIDTKWQESIEKVSGSKGTLLVRRPTAIQKLKRRGLPLGFDTRDK